MPAVALRTAKDTVHEPPAGSVPAVSENVVALATTVVGVNPTQPAPVTVTAPPVATRPAGKLSVRPGLASVRPTVFGCAIVKDSVASVLGATAVGENDLTTVTFENSVALAAAVFVMFCVLVSAPAAIVFTYVPLEVTVTFTVMVQVPLASIAPPVSVKLPPFGAAVTVPPQVDVPFGAALFTSPAG